LSDAIRRLTPPDIDCPLLIFRTPNFDVYRSAATFCEWLNPQAKRPYMLGHQFENPR
jgi:hypothetical protein